MLVNMKLCHPSLYHQNRTQPVPLNGKAKAAAVVEEKTADWSASGLRGAWPRDIWLARPFSGWEKPIGSEKTDGQSHSKRPRIFPTLGFLRMIRP
jgi:hypothetical protein